jgi:hypothetical protein
MNHDGLEKKGSAEKQDEKYPYESSFFEHGDLLGLSGF